MEKFKGKYIVVAIDGTGSAEWRNSAGTNSFTYLFYRDFDHKGGAKRYWHGPGGIYNDATKHRNFGERLIGAPTGYGSERITQEAVSFIKTALIKILGFDLYHEWEVPIASKFYDSFKWTETRRRVREKVRIILIGHSRGGAIAVNVANIIQPFQVYFMALYDAVDMNLGQECGYIHDAKYTYHAKRHGFKSRNSWGNCGDTTLQHLNRPRLNPTDHLNSFGYYEHKYFQTSHGGIGGDTSQKLGTPMVDDMSCLDAYIEIPTIPTLYFNTSTLRVERSSGYKRKIYFRNRMRQCIKGSKAADAWMRQKAQERGLPLSQ